MLSKIKEEALKNRIPIVDDEALNFILNLIKKHNIKSILEIGTAVGYSAISFAYEDLTVDTIEHDYDRYLKALENIKLTNLEDKIKVFNTDALVFETDKKFDLIYIDAAKAKYLKFFKRFEANLNDGGIIVCDNINFHNLDKTKVKRRIRQLLEKLEAFKEFLVDNENYTTDFYNVGDGLSVSVKK